MFAIVQSILAALAGRTVTVSVVLNAAKPLVVEDAANQAAAGSTGPLSLTHDQAKARLRELLSNPKYKFRSIDKLVKAVGGQRFEVEDMLADIGARPSRRNANLFGLTSRVGQRAVA